MNSEKSVKKLTSDEKKIFISATDENIKKGEVTDVYFIRTVTILKKDNLADTNVAAEFTISSLPKDYRWIVFGGIREVIKLLEGLPVDVYAIPEGTILPHRDINGIRVPVITIMGPYGKFAIYETPILGFLAAGSGYATKAARIRKIAGDDVLIVNFGARRTHPAIAPFCDYYSYIGGFNSVSCILGAKYLGKNPTGTMPHSLLIIYKFTKGDHAEGWVAFDKYMPEEVPRIMLTDTFSDEVEEAIRAVEKVGPNKIWGVRLDTPGSRRGDFAEIIREVIWKLRQRGYGHVKIFVSGGINEKAIPELKAAGAVGFGVGSAVANAPYIDFAMDIIAIKRENTWIPISKRGKYDGIKQVWRFKQNGKIKYVVTPIDKKPDVPDAEPLLVKMLENGKIVYKYPEVDKIRNYVLSQLESLDIQKLPWE